MSRPIALGMRLEGESVIEDGAEVGELEDFGDWEGGRGED